MRTGSLTATQIERFHRDGVLVVRSFLGADQVAASGRRRPRCRAAVACVRHRRRRRAGVVERTGRRGLLPLQHAAHIGSQPSAASRELLLIAYNTRGNDPVRIHHHPNYTPIDVVPDTAVAERFGRYDGEARSFLTPAQERGEEATR